jgi:HK97 family phage prohead protease
MPYFIEDENPDCAGWAVVKQDGELMGCHGTKQDAIDQMVALSLEEGIEPGGERGEKRELPDAYRPALSDDVPEGRACGNCIHYDESNIDGDRAWCELWDEYVRGDYYCDRWQGEERSQRAVELNVPQYIQDAAARGLELNREGFGGDGLADSTLREARLMANGEISEDKVIRANAWGARHAVDLEADKNSDSDHEDWPGAGAVAHYLWGINPLNPEPAREWFARKAEQIKEERGADMATTITRSTDDIVRQLDFAVEQNSDGLTLDGYGAVFNQWTEIEDQYGLYRERIAAGAFKRTLGMRMPILQFDHGSHPLIGSIPLGRITSLVEDAHGLRVKARLSDNWLVQPVRDAIRDGGITGMSFRFRIIDEDWARAVDGMEERTINEVELYEVGPVVFPAYEQTSVGVRSRDALAALEDAQVREEVAHILAAGGDLRSISTIDISADSNEVHSAANDSPAESHLSLPTKTQRLAKVMLAGIDPERD